MSSFSERYGYIEPRNVIQRESIDGPLRIDLWNLMELYFWAELRDSKTTYLHPRLAQALWAVVLGQTLDELPDWWSELLRPLRQRVLAGDWNRVYDLIEFLAVRTKDRAPTFPSACNDVLTRGMAAYRIVEGRVVELTSEAEIETITNALHGTRGIGGADTHLASALRLLSDRDTPDYRNSIKEAISAVEGVANAITGTRGTLGDALNRLDSSIDTHRALRDAFSKLYGYTSDAEGIRHALLEEPNLRQEDATFMLVACSAFINYLIAKAAAAGLQLAEG